MVNRSNQAAGRGAERRGPGGIIPAAVIRARAAMTFAGATALVLGLTSLWSPPPVVAQTDIKLLVTIYKVWERGCYGEETIFGCIGGEDADFYTVTYLDGQKWQSQIIED